MHRVLDPPRSRLTVWAACAVLAIGVIAGCSNGESAGQKQPHTGSAAASTVDGVQQVTIHTTDFRFHPSTITVHQGKVHVILINDSGGTPHDWQLPKFPSDWVPLTANGQSKQTTFTTPAPGRYQFVCTIHIKQGMVGTLVVVPD